MVLRLGPIVAVAAVALLGACKYGTRPDDVLSTTQQIDLVESAPLAFAPWTNRAIPYCVGPGDKLRIKFTVTREMDEDVVVVLMVSSAPAPPVRSTWKGAPCPKSREPSGGLRADP